MSEWHLEELRDGLRQRGWSVVSEQDGNDYDISAVWVIQRSTRRPDLHIEFEGLDDLVCLPIEKSYGCQVREDSKVGIYFAKKKRWKAELAQFLCKLDSIEDGGKVG